MNTKKLRQKILDLAIRGKLVPQDPNDEPASILLQRIRAEKERLISEGKIKRPKKAKASSSESHYQQFEPPFPIPDSWEWCKLVDCCHIVGRIGFRGYTKDDLVCENNGAITLSPSNIVNGSMHYDKCTYISWDKYYESPEIQVQDNDILLVKTGSSYGKCALVKNLPKEATINPQYVVLKHIRINPEYLTILLQSDYAHNCYEKFVLGTAIPTFTQENLSNLAVPLPPYNEQLRILQRLHQIQDQVGLIEHNITELSSRIKNAKSKILELAMQGKLVPQDPADEPAANMLRRINPNAKIITDNPHYPQLPDNWVLVSLEDITEYEQPQPYIVQDTTYSERYTIPVLTAGKSFILGYTNEDFGVYENVPAIIFDDFTTDSRLVNFPFKVKSSAMKIIQVKRGLNIEYIALFMSITRLIGETHKRYWISEYSKILIPIPPLKEQDRIVERVNFLYHELDKIISVLTA